MLKDIASIVQICFYVVGATIAILTYRSAKRGLLNTVNTEYHKRVLDHLHELSETLYTEFEFNLEDHSDKNHPFTKTFNINLVVEEIVYYLSGYVRRGGIVEKNNLDAFMDFFYAYPIIFKKSVNMRNQIESDPFIPENIANYVVKYLDERASAVREIIRFQRPRYVKVFIDNERYILESLETNNNVIDERIYSLFAHLERDFRSQLTLRELGPIHNLENIHAIRTMIRDYLKSFNPLP
ncbi:hypothetical protein [Priestia megaterium]|uniref:hypothetical protein n=1 Tax=Priestia megaterium TaxID=1404 RepID=UPI001FB261D4|nr:hypothetical protein [Priestia megaterium]